MDAHTVALLLDEPVTHTPPFVPDGEEGWWTLEDPALLPPVETARATPAPYPGLVTIGSGSSGEHLLLHLPYVRTLLLEGSTDQVRTAARAMALDAATAAWSDHAEVLTVGLGTELPALLPHGRLRAGPHLRAATGDLGAMLVEMHQREAGEEPLPWLLICAAEATPEDASALADALASTRDLPVALVLPASGLGSVFPEAEHLDAAAYDAQPCTTLESTVELGHVADAEYEALTDTLRITEEPARPAVKEWSSVRPPEPEAASAPQPPSAPVPEQAAGEEPFPALLAATEPSAVRLAAAPEQAESSAAGDGGSTEQPMAAQEGPTAVPDAAAEPEKAPVDLHAPEIRVMGPVSVTGIQGSGHGYRLAALAALIYLRPGRSAEDLCEAMDPARRWPRRSPGPGAPCSPA